MSKKLYEKYEVYWADAAVHKGWNDKSDKFSPSKCKSVGYLVDESKSHMAFAQSFSDDLVAEVLSIPKLAINKIRRTK